MSLVFNPFTGTFDFTGPPATAPVTPASPDTSVQFNNAGAFGGDAAVEILQNSPNPGDPTALVVTSPGSAFGNLAIANNAIAGGFPNTGTGLSVLESTSDPFYAFTSFYVATEVDADVPAQSGIFDVDVQTDLTHGIAGYGVNIYGNGHSLGLVQGDDLFIFAPTSIVNNNVYGRTVEISVGSTTRPIYANLATLTVNGTQATVYGHDVNLVVTDLSTATTTYAYHAGAPTLLGSGSITNAYYVWFDSQGVYRIREDARFNNVAQAIPALYNPQYTKYTPGAKAFERGILGQWESNIFTIRTENGPTQTLDSLTSVGTTATASLTSHGYLTGDLVTIAGANQAPYNGQYSITRVDDDTFTYTFAGSGTSPATGTITAQAGTLEDIALAGAGIHVTSANGSGATGNDIHLVSGDGDTGFNGGHIIGIAGGSATGTDAGRVEWRGGDSTGMAAGGAIVISGGLSASGAGGVTGLSGGTGATNGGDVNITGGNGVGGGHQGGDIVLLTGSGSGGATNGNLKINGQTGDTTTVTTGSLVGKTMTFTNGILTGFA